MEVVGPILLVLSIPMMFRWIPPNRLYGFRIPATLRDKSVWYDANARSGRHLFLLGLLLVVLAVILPLSLRNQTMQLVVVVAFAAITFFDWRTANRWERERSDRSDSH